MKHTLTTIALLSSDSPTGRAIARHVVDAGISAGELLRLSRLGLVDLILCSRPERIAYPGVPVLPDGFGHWVPVEYVSLNI